MKNLSFALLLTLSTNAFADLGNYADQLTMRCGPADAPISVKLSGKVSAVLKCVDRYQEAVLSQNGPATVQVGQNNYEAVLSTDLLRQNCAYFDDDIYFTLTDKFGSYVLSRELSQHAFSALFYPNRGNRRGVTAG